MLGDSYRAFYQPAFIVLLAGLALTPRLPAQQPVAEASSPTPASVRLAEKARIGQPGMGPGMLSDPKYVAVDGKGFIYVTEGSRNRIQRFDPDGKFESLFFVDLAHPDESPGAMTVDRGGVVYVSNYAQLDRYDGATGKHLGRVEGPDAQVHSLAPMPDGGVLVAWGSAIVLLDRQGKVVRSTDFPDTNMDDIRVAIDGEGWLYIIGDWFFNEAPLKRFKLDGKLVSMFGSEWSETKEMASVGGLAIDGQGRLFIAHRHGIDVYSRAGRKLGSLPGQEVRGIAVNERGEILAATGDRVIRVAVAP